MPQHSSTSNHTRTSLRVGLGDLLSTQHGVQLPWKRLVQGWQAGRLLKQKVEWRGAVKAPECLDTHRAALSLSGFLTP